MSKTTLDNIVAQEVADFRQEYGRPPDASELKNIKWQAEGEYNAMMDAKKKRGSISRDIKGSGRSKISKDISNASAVTRASKGGKSKGGTKYIAIPLTPMEKKYAKEHPELVSETIPFKPKRKAISSNNSKTKEVKQPMKLANMDKTAEPKPKKSFWGRQADVGEAKKRINRQADFDEGKKRIGKTKSWFGKQGSLGAGHDRLGRAAGSAKRLAWTNPHKRDQYRRHVAQPSGGISGAVRSGGRKLSSFGYALPGPLSVWTLAWNKTSSAIKALTVLVFALVLLFVPVGVFWYAGWAVGAAFMFLISLIFWVFVSLFNGIAYVMVSAINGLVTIIMGVVINIVESILRALRIAPVWGNGRDLLANSLIRYDQIANVPSLYHIVTPGWEAWMNQTIIAYLLNAFGVDVDFSWLFSPFRDFYVALPAENAVIIGLCIILVPVVFLIYVYYKNRHYIYS